MRAISNHRLAAALLVIFVTSAGFAQQPAPISEAAPVTITGTREEIPPLIMVKLPKPIYPKEARGVSGWVRVECWVTPRGRIQSVTVVASEPAGVFDAAAVAAMKKVRFKPFDSEQPRLMTQRLIFSSP